MTHRICTAEPDILTAAAEGAPLPPAMEAHLWSCPSCREQAEAARFMRRLSSAPTAAHQLPDPPVIWWKAQLARRWQAERAAAPIERMRGIELGAGLVSLAVFLIWQWRGFVDMVSRAIPTAIPAASQMPQAANPITARAVTIGILDAPHLRSNPYARGLVKTSIFQGKCLVVNEDGRVLTESERLAGNQQEVHNER